MEVSYDVTLHHEDDGSYWAEVEQLPGCFASGFSLDEVWEALAEAMSLYMSTPGSTATARIKRIEHDESDSDVGESVQTRVLVC